MKRKLGISCIILTFISMGAGFYYERKARQIERSLLDEYQLYKNSHVIEYDEFWHDRFDKAKDYVFPGTEWVVHSLSNSEAIPFDVEFLPTVINGDSIRWHATFKKSVHGRVAGGKVDYYRGVPWDMMKVGSGTGSIGPSSSLIFAIENNPDLAGRQLYYRIITDDFERTYSIWISNPKNLRVKLMRAKGENWVTLRVKVLYLLAIGALFSAIYMLHRKTDKALQPEPDPGQRR